MRLVAGLALVATPALAQELSARVPAGRLVELQTRGLIVESLRGRAAALDSAGISLAVTRAGSTVMVPWNNVTSLRWSTERSRSLGALDGATFGVLLGAILYVNSYPWGVQGTDADEIRRRLLNISTTVAIGATGIGVVAGSRRWQSIPLPPSGTAPLAVHFSLEDAVRVESTLGRIIGHNAVASDSLRLTTSAGPLSLAWRTVGDLQVRGGKRRDRGVITGVGIALVAGTLAETCVNFTRAERVAHLVGGGIIGFRFLSPEGWISLPQPGR